MKAKALVILFLSLIFKTHIVLSETGVTRGNFHPSSNETSYSLYINGVERGVIDTTKYPFQSFVRDEENIFKELYQTFLLLNDTEPISYKHWLALNNYGIISETGESYYKPKIKSSRTKAENKKRFVNTVKKGDILITGRGVGGLIGHAAIMTTDYWVLEMPGGKGLQNGLKSNNRQIGKDKWFDKHATDWTSVYRCPNGGAARDAANWADRNYYNPSGGSKKTKHITYKLTTDVKSTNPSYCFKLVIQAYYFGTGNRKVIVPLLNGIIVPSTIPSYFLKPYVLQFKGKF